MADTAVALSPEMTRVLEEGNRFRVVFDGLEGLLHTFWDEFQGLLDVAEKAMPLIPKAAGYAVLEAARRDLAISRMMANTASVKNLPADPSGFLDFASTVVDEAADWMTTIEEYIDEMRQRCADLQKDLRRAS